MNQQTIEQVRAALERGKFRCASYEDDAIFDAALAALSSAESEPTDDRIKFGVITWDGVKYPQILFQGQPMFWGDDPHEEDHSSYMREFIEFLQARLSPPSTHSDVSQDEADVNAYIIDRMSQMLARIAIAVKGPELPLRRHGYQDLPDIVEKAMIELAIYREGKLK